MNWADKKLEQLIKGTNFKIFRVVQSLQW